MMATNPFDAGVEPWQMLGFLQGALERDGSISPEVWEAAIASQTSRKLRTA